MLHVRQWTPLDRRLALVLSLAINACLASVPTSIGLSSWPAVLALNAALSWIAFTISSKALSAPSLIRPRHDADPWAPGRKRYAWSVALAL